LGSLGAGCGKQRNFRRIALLAFWQSWYLASFPSLAQESTMLALYTNLSLRLRRDEKGATAVEYGIMVALIAVVIIVAVACSAPP
jgi:pilus assembly protein Flp/PilA